MLRVNILAVAGAGLMILLTGLLLLAFADSVSQYRRFFLPIPPLGVAAYVFVFNVFQHYDGNLPAPRFAVVLEVISGAAVAAAVFFVFSVLLIATINQLK